MEAAPHRPSWLERLLGHVFGEPEDREQLLELLQSAQHRQLLDADALAMIEGVLQVADMSVRDIMVPRAQMDVISIQAPLDEILKTAIETAHSRFPVIDTDKDHVLGVLLAKDLLRQQTDPDFNVRDSLRPAVFIPESKRLNVLLKDFRSNRNHMAIVVDEYGGVAGLVTIEDVMEQIVGDIEDEYDFDETEDHIVMERPGRYRIKAITPLENVNEALGIQLAREDCDTLGGWVIQQFGRVPKRGDSFKHAALRVEVLRADSRRVHSVLLSLSAPEQTVSGLPPA